MAYGLQWIGKLSDDPFCCSRNYGPELRPPYLTSGIDVTRSVEECAPRLGHSSGRDTESAEACRSQQMPFSQGLVRDDASVAPELSASERELKVAQAREKTAALTGALIKRSYYVAAEEELKQEAMRLKRERQSALGKENDLTSRPPMIQSEKHIKRCEHMRIAKAGAEAHMMHWRQEIANLQSRVRHTSSGEARKIPYLPIWLAHADQEICDGERALDELNIHAIQARLATMSIGVTGSQNAANALQDGERAGDDRTHLKASLDNDAYVSQGVNNLLTRLSDTLETFPKHLGSSSHAGASQANTCDITQLHSDRLNDYNFVEVSSRPGNIREDDLVQVISDRIHYGTNAGVLANDYVVTQPSYEHPKGVHIAESSSIDDADGYFVDLFQLAPLEHTDAYGQVEWLVSLDEHAEPKVGQSIEHKMVTQGGGGSMSEDLHRESYTIVFMWNAWEQSVEQDKREANWTFVDSSEFSLLGEGGFYLRYWPHWDVATDIACLRIFGPIGCQPGHFRLGIGEACSRDVEMNQEVSGQIASEVWFFTSSDTKGVRNLEQVWVAKPAEQQM